MDLELTGKTALITGGSKGIGFAIADRLAAEGCHVRLAARAFASSPDASAFGWRAKQLRAGQRCPSPARTALAMGVATRA